jgi:hypothetical protein
LLRVLLVRLSAVPAGTEQLAVLRAGGSLTPRPKGEKHPADVIGATVMIGKIATGEIDDLTTDAGKNAAGAHGRESSG